MPGVFAIQKFDTVFAASDGRGMVTLGHREIPTTPYPHAQTFAHHAEVVPGTILFEYMTECKLLGVVYEVNGNEARYWPLPYTMNARAFHPMGVGIPPLNQCMIALLKLTFGYSSSDFQNATPAVSKQQVCDRFGRMEEHNVELGFMKVDAEPRIKPTLAHIPGFQTPVIDCGHILVCESDQCLN